MDKWVQPTTKETSYALGAKVLHKGAVWESTTKDNMGEPGVANTWRLIEKSLRTKALDAYNAEQTAWKADAQAALTRVIGPDSADTMEMTHTELTEAFHLAVWSDGDLQLATQKRSGFDTPWHVYLVADESGWTIKSDILTNLADLGRALL